MCGVGVGMCVLKVVFVFIPQMRFCSCFLCIDNCVLLLLI